MVLLQCDFRLENGRIGAMLAFSRRRGYRTIRLDPLAERAAERIG
jgi:hypothetical protein